MPIRLQISPPKSIEGSHPVFDPNVLMMVEQVVDLAWLELVRRGSPAATRRGERVVRKAMARRVFSRVAGGDVNAGSLVKHALTGFLDPLGD